MDEVKAPDGTVFTLKVPIDREKTNVATFYLKEITEDVFMAAKSMIDQRKTFDAVRMIVKALSLPGSDSADLLKANFIALNSCSAMILEIIEPVAGEIKKN